MTRTRLAGDCRSRFAALLLPAALAFAAPVAAQLPPPVEVPARLTVEDALRLAREHNPALRRAGNDGAVAAAQLRQAWSAFLPELGTSLGFGAGSSRSVTGQDDFGRPVTLPDARSFRSSRASQSINANLTLFDGTANLQNLRARRADARAVDLSFAAQQSAVEAQVRRAFYQTLRAERSIALEEQLLASARDRVERAEQLLRLAANDQVDVLGARADAASQEQKLERARGEARKSKLALLQTIGIEATSGLELHAVLPDVFDPAALDVDSLVAVAAIHNPGIAQRGAQQVAAERRASAARGSRLPRITMAGSYGRSMNLNRFEALGELNPQNTQLDFSLNVSLPLFTRFGTGAQIAQADAQAEDAREDARATRLDLAAEVRSAHIDLANAFRSLELAELSAELSRERLELAQEKYRLGALGFTELQNVIDRTAQAQRDAIDARFGFLAARVALEEKLGTSLVL